MHNALDSYLDALYETVAEWNALNTMIYHSLEANGGGALHSVAGGVSGLMNSCSNGLESCIDTMVDLLREERKSGLAIKDAAVIAKLTGVSIRDVKLVLWAACGSRVDDFTDSMLADEDTLYEVLRHKLREADLVERARGTVSEWSGVPRETVEKVLHAAGEAATEFMVRRHKAERAPEAMQLDADVQAALKRYREASALSGKDVADASGHKAASETVSLADAESVAGNLAEGPIPDHFRAEALAERLSEGVDASKIAKAVNLKPETVERVIAQLLAEPEDTGKATGTEG